jgi:ketopantoate reductase
VHIVVMGSGGVGGYFGARLNRAVYAALKPFVNGSPGKAA